MKGEIKKMQNALIYRTMIAYGNSRLEARFGLDTKDASIISRLFKDTINMELVKLLDSETNSRYYKYLPFWA